MTGGWLLIMTLFDEPDSVTLSGIPINGNTFYDILDRHAEYADKLKGKIKDLDKWMESPRIKLGCKSPNYLIWHNDTELLDKLIDSGEFQ